MRMRLTSAYSSTCFECCQVRGVLQWRVVTRVPGANHNYTEEPHARALVQQVLEWIQEKPT